MMELMIRDNVSINMKDVNGSVPLHFSALTGTVDIQF